MSEPYRVVSALPSGTAFARYVMVKALAQGDVYTELALAEKLKDSPTVHATVELQTKAAVAVGTTSDATWAGPLAVYGIAGEALVARRVHHRRARVENAARAVSDEGRARDGQRHRRRVDRGRTRDARGSDRV